MLHLAIAFILFVDFLTFVGLRDALDEVFVSVVGLGRSVLW